jgi:hypothetical protein
MSKVKGGERIRTDAVQGTCLDYPVIGESFALIAESLSFQGGVRLITTSHVKSITEQDDSLIIETENSTYQLIITE